MSDSADKPTIYDKVGGILGWVLVVLISTLVLLVFLGLILRVSQWVNPVTN